jgi:tRNA-dihydrouridine synthase
MAEDIGVEAIAVHPRTRMQGLDGAANWQVIHAVKQVVRIPVIGNGDVRKPADAVRMVSETGCDAVMIGRTAATNPWIFRQIEQLLAVGHYDEPTDFDRHSLLAAYFRSLVDSQMPDALGKMKQFACWFTHGVRNGSILRRQVHSARSTQEVLDGVDSFFAALAPASN